MLEELCQELSAAVAGLVPGAPMVWREVGDLRGYFLDEESALRPLPADKVEAVMREPPFWALLWPSGERLCRALAARPDLVAGLSVLDFGSGCGLVACAAARGGAAHTCAVDNDPLAAAAGRLHALANGVELSVRAEVPEGRVDLLLLADFLYDRSHLPLFRYLRARAAEIVVVDSRLTALPEPGLEYLGEATGRAVPDLDPHGEFGRLRFWYQGPRRRDWESCLGLSGPVAR
jgi:predicted nicotinamide N-methyase